jgi:hypothetical protein
MEINENCSNGASISENKHIQHIKRVIMMALSTVLNDDDEQLFLPFPDFYQAQ